jgi:hypothetical protein
MTSRQWHFEIETESKMSQLKEQLLPEGDAHRIGGKVEHQRVIACPFNFMDYFPLLLHLNVFFLYYFFHETIKIPNG